MKSFKYYVLILTAVILSLQAFLGTSKVANAASTDIVPSAPLFCASIDTIGTRMIGQLTPVAKQSLANLDNPTNIKARQTAIQQELTQKRLVWDSERNQQYDKMMSLAQNDAQKTAIETFKSSVEEAIVLRRESVDGAISTYFDHTANHFQTESSQITTARDDFITDVTTAVNNAKSDCQAKKPADEIRSNFQTSLAAARSKLQTTREEITEFKTHLETMRKEEATSINKAINVFQNTLSKAKQTLIDELKKSGANTVQFDI